MEMEKAMIVANPSSGREEAEQYIAQLQHALEKKITHIVTHVTESEENIARFSDTAAVEQYDALYLMGGDGTIHKGVNRIAHFKRRPKLGVIPLGTVNNFARSLGISPSPEKAIAQMEEAVTRQVDIGKVNNLFFISTVSAGPIPETAYQVDAEEKAEYGPLAYLIEGVKALNDDNPARFYLTQDGKQLEETFSLVLFALSHSVVGIQTFFPHASIDDGLLQFMGLKETTAMEKLALVPELFQPEGDYSDDLIHHSFQKGSIHAVNREESSMYCTVDGEKGPAFPLAIEVYPRYLEVFVPQDE